MKQAYGNYGRIAGFIACLAILFLLVSPMPAQVTSDVLGQHDLSPGGASPIQGTRSGPCVYCHAPHAGKGGQLPLWSQQLSSVTNYKLYTSTTMANTTTQPPLGGPSSLCLSCHDGTVAPGQLTPYGSIKMSGSMLSQDVVGTDLSSDHPFSFALPIVASPDLQPALTAKPPTTADTTKHVQLINGNVECTSCHNPHVQNIDPNTNFLVIDNTNGALCMACHTSTPTGSGMGLNATQQASAAKIAVRPTKVAKHEVNPLEGWGSSSHATAPNRIALTALDSPMIKRRAERGASLFKYPTVSKNGCLACHQSHNVMNPAALLRGVDDQACISCHSGAKNISPQAPDIFTEMASPKISHSFPSSGTNSHQTNEAPLLEHNRHATCVDCHNPHSSQHDSTLGPAPGIRGSQGRVVGISATDGSTVLTPSVNQYENCLRCHGTSSGKQSRAALGYLPYRAVSAVDQLNLIPQFASIATSSHPVTHDRHSPFPQPSLREFMLQLDGTSKGRGVGMRILCTDCHNSDDNREFGGSGPNGPHGSTFSHILERRYEFSQAPMPGKLITNLSPTPNLSAAGGQTGGPYALCAKCHDLKMLMSSASWSEHARHINDGFSCSVCHTAHGMGATSGTFSGERLVNFDVNVVAPNGSQPISYNRATNSCNLTCHSHPHQAGVGTIKSSVK